MITLAALNIGPPLAVFIAVRQRGPRCVMRAYLQHRAPIGCEAALDQEIAATGHRLRRPAMVSEESADRA